jgi:nucleotide-binding universal stress UspA family protein
MSLFRSVVCAVDFSENSRAAARYAAALAGRGAGRLTVLNVIDPLLVQAAAAAYDSERLRAEIEAELKQLVADIIPMGAAWAPPVRTVVTEGAAARQILARATAERADLLAIGTQGLGALGRWVFGSTSHAVLRESAVPVLVVPPGDSVGVELSASGVSFRFGRVLAGVDFSDTSERAARLAARLASALGVPLVLLHVISPASAAARWHDPVEAHAQHRAIDGRQRIEQLARTIEERAAVSTGNTVEGVVSIGRAADQIAAVALEREVGLIVVGLAGDVTDGSRPGSTAYRVLSAASVPVLAVPPGSVG